MGQNESIPEQPVKEAAQPGRIVQKQITPNNAGFIPMREPASNFASQSTVNRRIKQEPIDGSEINRGNARSNAVSDHLVSRVKERVSLLTFLSELTDST